MVRFSAGFLNTVEGRPYVAEELRSYPIQATPWMFEERLPGEQEQDERVREQLSRLLPNRSRLTLCSGVVTNDVAPGDPVTVTEWADREFPPDDQPWVAPAVAAMIERQQRREAQRRPEPHWVAMNQNHRRQPRRRRA